MDFAYTDEQQLVRDTVREFAEKELLPGALKRDKKKLFAREQWEKFSALGFAGMTIDEAYGGTPLDAVSECIVIEELSRCDASFGVLMAVHCGPHRLAMVTTWANDGAKAATSLPKMASGEWIAAYSLSEAGAGSDATAISCKARLDGDEWVLNGTQAVGHQRRRGQRVHHLRPQPSRRAEEEPDLRAPSSSRATRRA